jgi:DNA replication protein DnaC
MENESNAGPPGQLPGNTTTSTPERPRPNNRKCLGGCGKEFKPYFEPRSGLFRGGWFFDYETCPECLDRQREAYLARLREKDILASEQKLREMMGERGFEDYRFDKYHSTEGNKTAFDACFRFNPETDNLYLWGPAGTGKSHLAGAVVKGFEMLGKMSKFIKHPKLNRSFQGLKSDEYDSELERHIGYNVLAIDDLGVAKQTEHAHMALYDLIDGRYMAKRNGLIVTSNLSLGDMAERMGDDRLASRLAGMCRVIKIGGSDWRIKR